MLDILFRDEEKIFCNEKCVFCKMMLRTPLMNHLGNEVEEKVQVIDSKRPKSKRLRVTENIKLFISMITNVQDGHSTY